MIWLLLVWWLIWCLVWWLCRRLLPRLCLWWRLRCPSISPTPSILAIAISI